MSEPARKRTRTTLSESSSIIPTTSAGPTPSLDELVEILRRTLSNSIETPDQTHQMKQFDGLMTDYFVPCCEGLKRSLAQSDDSNAENKIAIIDAILTKMSSKKISIDFTDLTQTWAFEDSLNIKYGPVLGLVVNPSRLEASRLLGHDKFMSSKTMYANLNMIQETMVMIPQSNATERACIDVFLYRAAAMITLPHRMVIETDCVIPSTDLNPNPVINTNFTTVSGTIDYAAVVVENKQKVCRTQHSSVCWKTGLPLPVSSFYIARYKAHPGKYPDHSIRTVAVQLYALAKHFKLKYLRGALTDGHFWVFIIVSVTDEEVSYRQTTYLECNPVASPTQLVKKYSPDDPQSADLVAAVLAYWIQHSFEDIGPGDWYRVNDKVKSLK